VTVAPDSPSLYFSDTREEEKWNSFAEAPGTRFKDDHPAQGCAQKQITTPHRKQLKLRNQVSALFVAHKQMFAGRQSGQSASHDWLVQVLLKSHFAYFLRPAEVGNGVRNRVGILQPEQRR
jgi:hypothetical protein